MPGRPIIFLDLDDTLFSSRRKSPGDLSLFEPVAYGKQGEPLSYMSARQRQFFEWLRKDAEVVPTTGRNGDAYRRVRLPFAGHAILSHGGLIIDKDGVPDPGWHALVTRGAAECRAMLHDLSNAILDLARREQVDIRARPIPDEGLDLYCSVKHNQEDAAALSAFSPHIRKLVPEGWTLHLNDNNLAVMPPFVSKAAAVTYFLENLADDPAFVLGIGDSLSDLPFMALTDIAMMPTTSQAFHGILERVYGV